MIVQYPITMGTRMKIKKTIFELNKNIYMPIRKSHFCQRAICYISDTDMIYSLALSALGSVSEIPRLRPPCRMPPFVSNVLCPYESNDKAKAENLSKVVLAFWSVSISLSNLLLKCPRVRYI